MQRQQEEQTAAEARKQNELRIAKRRAKLSEKKLMQEKYKSMKIRVPFPGVPSFLASANIMSYFGYEDEIRHVLSRLNRNSRTYYICH